MMRLDQVRHWRRAEVKVSTSSRSDNYAEHKKPYAIMMNDVGHVHDSAEPSKGTQCAHHLDADCVQCMY